MISRYFTIYDQHLSIYTLLRYYIYKLHRAHVPRHKHTFVNLSRNSLHYITIYAYYVSLYQLAKLECPFS